MITAIVYLLDGLILTLFSYKVWGSLKNKNPFMEYFLGITTFFSINFILYFIFITLAVYLKDPVYLFWADFLGRLFVYIGSIFAVQVPLFELWPKSNLRFAGSAVVGAWGFTFAYLNLIYPNHPYVDNLNIIHWQAPTWLGIGLGAIILGIWIPTSLIFINQYIKSRYKLRKSLILGLGFLIGAFGAALQDFGKSPISYVLINLILTAGFLLIFWGVFYKDKKYEHTNSRKNQ